MLVYILALLVGSGSVGLYLAAFLFPEVHRRFDLVWSGVGCFYALVLWVCAGRITGALLLGQVANVALLGWLSWQTLSLRRAQTPVLLQTQLPPEANSASDVFQLTVRQLRANLHQSAGRSSLVEQLDQGIARLETAWLGLQSWGQAWRDTTQKGGLRAERAPAPDQPLAPPAPYAKPDLYAEWSDLELESYPDLDTTEAAPQREDYPPRLIVNRDGAEPLGREGFDDTQQSR
jgi:hypothetical protein